MEARTDGHLVPPDQFAEQAIAAPRTAERTDLLWLLTRPMAGAVGRETVARLLDALHEVDALDGELVETAFTADTYLGNAVFGREPDTGRPVPAVVRPACAAWIRDRLDELTWRLTAAPNPLDWDHAPRVPAPRGLRFVLRGLDVWSDRLASASGAYDGDSYRAQVINHLCAAELTDDERADLVEALRARPEAEQREALIRRYAVGDAEPLLVLFGLDGAGPLLRLLIALSARGVSTAGGQAVGCDLAQIRAAVAASGEDQARRLCALLEDADTAVEPVAAAMGWNRPAVLRRFGHHALQGIAAYGLLPLAPGESVVDRYLELRRSDRKGATFGPNRRLSHADAVRVALGHLAQVAGYPDATRLEWDMEARIATETPGDLQTNGYTIAIEVGDAEPVITISRNGRVLKSVPAALRKDPAYAQAREYQERLRGQARRMRTGLLERLAATADPVPLEELARLLSLPAGTAMLPALIWRDDAGATGLLDPTGPALVDLDGTRTAVTGPVRVAHPWHLYQAGALGAWQAEIVRRRLRQPVKQAFRELYLLTPAERDAGTISRRFAGHTVSGKIAARLLADRGWSILGGYDDHQATRTVGGLVAGVRCELHGPYFAAGEVTVGAVTFRRGGAPVDLAEVPPVALSEVMRDLDLVVSVAGDGTRPPSPAGTLSRAELLGALIADLGLTRVSVDGHVAVVRGSRASYRVHLGSGSIHVEPGGHLCIVPASFGERAHRRLFLPFADRDTTTSVILSKVLLLAEDEKITDTSILSQLPRAAPAVPKTSARSQ